MRRNAETVNPQSATDASKVGGKAPLPIVAANGMRGKRHQIRRNPVKEQTVLDVEIKHALDVSEVGVECFFEPGLAVVGQTKGPHLERLQSVIEAWISESHRI